MSRRAYKAALAGLRSVTLDRALDGRGSRKRVVLDLVRTELDFDAEPKMKALGFEINRGISAFGNMVTLAANAKETNHLVHCIETYREIARDLERVKEIRTRARERGQVPSARPLRFERADVPKRRNDEQTRAYMKAYASAKPIARRALMAWKNNRRLRFADLWLTDRRRNALATFDRERSSESDRGIVWDLVPLHAMTPGDFHRLVELWSRDKKLVMMRRALKKKRFHDTDRIYFKQHAKKWRLDQW